MLVALISKGEDPRTSVDGLKFGALIYKLVSVVAKGNLPIRK